MTNILKEYQHNPTGDIYKFGASCILENNTILSTNKTPYLRRQALSVAGASVYTRMKLVGGTFAVNQLFNLDSSNGSIANGTTTDLSASLSLVLRAANPTRILYNDTISNNKNISIIFANNDTSDAISLIHSGSARDIYLASYSGTIYAGHKYLFTCDIVGHDPTTDNGISGNNTNLIDLTQWFGSDIADYAYTLEQSEAGSGIAWLASYGFDFSKYIPYNTGSLQSVKTSGKKITGKNLLNQADVTLAIANYVIKNVPIYLPKGTYTFSFDFTGTSSSTSFRIDDANGNAIASEGFNVVSGRNSTLFTISEDGAFVKYYSNALGTYKNFMIALGEDTNYSPYWSNTIDLGNDELRGVSKLVSGEIQYDGDTKSADGNIDVKYGIVDLGSIDWELIESESTYKDFRNTSMANIIKPQTDGDSVANIKCAPFLSVSRSDQTNNHPINTVAITLNGYIRVLASTSYADAAAFKTAMSGVFLVYEKTTPTTSQSTPFDDPISMDGASIEEFIDNRTIPIPVGHETQYYTTSDELFTLPSNPYNGKWSLTNTVINGHATYGYSKYTEFTDEEKAKLEGISTNANKVSASTTNGNIKIDDTETQVYDDSGITDRLDTTTTSASGNPISISNLKSNQLAKDPIITLEPIQAGSGDPSPSNVRAISGYDKIEVLSCGKNILDLKAALDYWEAPYTYDKANDAYTITNLGSSFSNPYIFHKEPINITLSAESITYLGTASNWRMEIYDENNNNWKAINSSTLYNNTIFGNKLRMNYSSLGDGATFKKVQIEFGSNLTTYSPYNKSTSISESLGQTVYGGTLDVRTGVLTVDRAIVDLGDLSWTYNADRALFYATLSGYRRIENDCKGVCDSYNYVGTITGASDTKIHVNTSCGLLVDGTSYNRIYLKDTSYSDATVLTSALEGVKMVYELATPFTIQLTPHEISLLKDYAYVSTNGTSITLDYHNGELASLNDLAESELYTMSWVKKLMTRLSSVRLYAFHIDGVTGEVTYLEDNANYTPAYMDYTKGSFNYASWQDAFFMPKPCILGMDGHVKCYLDPYNYAKDIDGNSVAIDSTLTDGNVMIEYPKIWSKVVPDAGDPASATVYICNQQIDDEFKDDAYIDSAGTHKEHMYTPAYNGSYDSNNKMRSISGAQVGKNLSGTTEIERAEANGAGWYTEDAGEVMLINFLLILMGKSVDTQTVFGQGLHTGGSEAINDGFRTGVHNTKGLFYGTNSGTIASGSYGNAVKVFGMENWWGFQWRRYAGDMLVDGVIKVKMCKGRNDGSTVSGYNTDATGYISTGVTPSGTNGGYITTMNFNKYGMFSSVSASSSTTYKDGQWYNTDTRYALRGGHSTDGALVGAFCVNRYFAVSYANWPIGTALSFK